MRGTSRLVKVPIKLDSSECDIVVITEEVEEEDEDQEDGGKLIRETFLIEFVINFYAQLIKFSL